MAALIQKPPCKIQVLLLSGHLVQLHKGQFDFLMTGNPVTLSGAEDAHHVVGHPLAHFQEAAASRGLIIRHGRLGHVSGTVHFVPVHVMPAVFQAGEGIKRIQITVGLLGGGELRHPLVALGFQPGVRLNLQGISHAFQGLVNI